MSANPVSQPIIDIPRHVWDAVNNAIHTSKIDGSVQPISLCYVAVRAALKAYVETPAPAEPLCEFCGEPLDVSKSDWVAKHGPNECYDPLLCGPDPYPSPAVSA